MFDRQAAVTALFAIHGQEKNIDRIRAYLMLFSDLTDDALQYAIKEASEGRVGNSDYLPSGPTLKLAARAAPPPPVHYEKLNDLPPVYEMLPGNRKRVTREAIVYFGREKVSEWIGQTITSNLLADESNENLLISPPKSEETRQAIRAMIRQLEYEKPKPQLRLASNRHGTAGE